MYDLLDRSKDLERVNKRGNIAIDSFCLKGSGEKNYIVNEKKVSFAVDYPPREIVHADDTLFVAKFIICSKIYCFLDCRSRHIGGFLVLVV